MEKIVISGWFSIAPVTLCDTGTEYHNFSLFSPVFKDGETIPKQYTGMSAYSPPLYWMNPPEGTISFALIMEDVISPIFKINHWVLYNIPSDNLELPEGMAHAKFLLNGTIQGRNFFLHHGYLGPNPLWGKHRYVLTIYALDIRFDANTLLNKTKLLKKMKGHILEQATITFYFKKGRQIKGTVAN